MSERLPEWKKNAKEKFLRLYRKFKEETGKSDGRISLEIDIPPSTMKSTLNGPNFNTDFAIAFCRTYHVADLNYLFSDVKEEAACVTFQLSTDCSPLDDEAFFGTFYGYCRNTQSEHAIEKFILRITREKNGDVGAEFTLYGQNQKSEAIKKILTGKPMHLKPDSIFIVLQSENGDDMFILSYNWFKISNGKKLYCRYGGTITPCRSTSRYTQLQSFLMLDKPVAPKNMHYLEGCLRLVQDRIIVPADKYDAHTGGLLATDEKVKMFFEKCRDLRCRREEFYSFSEEVLLAAGGANGIDAHTTAAVIMMLRANSINPKVVDFPNRKTYSRFFAGLTSSE